MCVGVCVLDTTRGAAAGTHLHRQLIYLSAWSLPSAGAALARDRRCHDDAPRVCQGDASVGGMVCQAAAHVFITNRQIEHRSSSGSQVRGMMARSTTLVHVIVLWALLPSSGHTV